MEAGWQAERVYSGLHGEACPHVPQGCRTRTVGDCQDEDVPWETLPAMRVLTRLAGFLMTTAAYGGGCDLPVAER